MPIIDFLDLSIGRHENTPSEDESFDLYSFISNVQFVIISSLI